MTAAKRWLDQPGWDQLEQSIQTLALACGASAHCEQKYGYLRVELKLTDVPEEQRHALQTLADLVEQISDTEDHGNQSTVHWVRKVISE